jgi:hypothetical protein
MACESKAAAYMGGARALHHALRLDSAGAWLTQRDTWHKQDAVAH